MEQPQSSKIKRRKVGVVLHESTGSTVTQTVKDGVAVGEHFEKALAWQTIDGIPQPLPEYRSIPQPLFPAVVPRWTAYPVIPSPYFLARPYPCCLPCFYTVPPLTYPVIPPPSFPPYPPVMSPEDLPVEGEKVAERNEKKKEGWEDQEAGGSVQNSTNPAKKRRM